MQAQAIANFERSDQDWHAPVCRAVLAVALGHRGEAAVIVAVVFVNALIGRFHEGRAERSMAARRRLWRAP